MIGRELGGYRIEAELGRGGMGVVYRATQLDLERPVALKILAEKFADDAAFVERFLRESRALARVNHPNVVHVYECGEAARQYFYAMELVEGESLEERLERTGRLPWRDALRIIFHACRGLHAAHQAGIVHRDIKPGNILIDAGGQTKVMDFGLAYREETTRITKSGGLLGTPIYMSPEQARGDDVDARSDIYSLGIVLYEMLTGAVPFDAANSLQTLHMHQHDPPRPPRKVRPELPPPVEQLVLGMLAKDPATRYQSSQEVMHALRAAAKGTDLTALSPAPPRGRLARLVGSRRRRLVLLVASGGLAAGVVLVATQPDVVFLFDEMLRVRGSKPYVAAEWTAPAAAPVPAERIEGYLDELFGQYVARLMARYPAAGPDDNVLLHLKGGALLMTTRVTPGEAYRVEVPGVEGSLEFPPARCRKVSVRLDAPAAFRTRGRAWGRSIQDRFRIEQAILVIRQQNLQHFLDYAAAHLPAYQDVVLRDEWQAVASWGGRCEQSRAALQEVQAALKAAQAAEKALVANATNRASWQQQHVAATARVTSARGEVQKAAERLRKDETLHGAAVDALASAALKLTVWPAAG